MKAMLVAAYVVAYVFWYVLASAAIDGIGVSEMLSELARNPQLLVTPGVFGNSASQLLAVYNAAATITLLAYLPKRRRRLAIARAAASAQEINRARAAASPTARISSAAISVTTPPAAQVTERQAEIAACDADHATLLGICAVAAGLFMLLSGWGWTEYSLLADWQALSVALASTVVALLLWYRFWRLADEESAEKLRGLSSMGFFNGLLTASNVVFALCALLTLCVLAIRAFGMMGAYMAVIGVPLALFSYFIVEGYLLFTRMHSRVPRARHAA